jgi:hypothetical protein
MTLVAYAFTLRRSAIVADAADIGALANNICCGHIGSLKKEQEQDRNDRSYDEFAHL